MRWFKIAVAVALAAAALLFFLGLPGNFMAAEVQSRIEAATGDRLSLGGETAIRLWPAPTIVLRDVTLFTGDDRGAAPQMTAERIRVVLSLRDLLFGHARIAELALSRPILRLPLPRERMAPAPVVVATDSAGSRRNFPTIDHIAIEDGTIAFYGLSGRDEGRLDRVNVEITHAPAARGASVTGSFFADSQRVSVDLKSQTLPEQFEEQAIPIQATLRAPGLSAEPLWVSAELRARNSALAVNTLSGKFGPSSFNGWANVDFSASKPEVTADLDFNSLQVFSLKVPAAQGSDAPQKTALSEPWSDHQYDFDPLNFFDVRMHLSTADFAVGSLHIAPFALQANLSRGVLKAKIDHAAFYGGTMDGTAVLDASGVLPAHALSLRLAGVNALPFLTDTASFDSLEGAMQADINVLATGSSEQAAMYSLGGTVDVHLSNGGVRGIDVAKITHNIASTVLDGWQWNASDRTPLTDLTAHFVLTNGVAATDDLTLSGPVVQMTGAGTIDISTKTLQMKVNPRLVDGGQDVASAASSAGAGQGGGFGVPVTIQGGWSDPRLVPDVSGILNDPGAALNQLGKSFFGDARQPSNNGAESYGGNHTFDNILDNIGSMLKGSGDHGGGTGR